MAKIGVATVLVVEDDEAVRGFLTYALRSGGFSAAGVSTGEEAIAVLRETEAAVILIDGILPDMHGLRVAQAILKNPEFDRVAISFLTGAIRTGRPPKAGVGALSKPLRARDLVDAVNLLVRWRNAGGSPVAERVAALAELEQLFLVGA